VGFTLPFFIRRTGIPAESIPAADYSMADFCIEELISPQAQY